MQRVNFKKARNMVGELVGLLWVLKPADKHDYYWCRCLCGNPELKRKHGKEMRRGSSRSCGCLVGKSKSHEDITGKSFGLWKVLRKVNEIGVVRWEVECQCDKKSIRLLSRDTLKKGRSKSCGCNSYNIHKERTSTHGMSHGPYYGIWEKIKDRCYNPKQKGYHNYGGRGIQIEEPWKSNPDTFIVWYKDQLNKRPGMVRPQVNRKDNDKNYCEGNCEVLPLRENNFNKRCNTIVDYKGQKVSAARIYYDYEMSTKIPSITYSAFISRVKKGWDIDLALTTKSDNRGAKLRKTLIYNGLECDASDFYYKLIDREKISVSTFKHKLNTISVDDLLKEFS